MPEGVTNWFLQQGFLGIFCIILMTVLVYVWRRLLQTMDSSSEAVSKIQSARVEDQKQLSAILDRQNAASKALVAEVNQMLIDQVRSNDKMVAHMTSLEKEASDMKVAFGRNTDSLDGLKTHQATFLASIERKAT